MNTSKSAKSYGTKAIALSLLTLLIFISIDGVMEMLNEPRRRAYDISKKYNNLVSDVVVTYNSIVEAFTRRKYDLRNR
jgi:hypothetical protein